jgi:hypothetical protein
MQLREWYDEMLQTLNCFTEEWAEGANRTVHTYPHELLPDEWDEQFIAQIQYNQRQR